CPRGEWRLRPRVHTTSGRRLIQLSCDRVRRETRPEVRSVHRFVGTLIGVGAPGRVLGRDGEVDPVLIEARRRQRLEEDRSGRTLCRHEGLGSNLCEGGRCLEYDLRRSIPPLGLITLPLTRVPVKHLCGLALIHTPRACLRL